jgi:hypothetical protein
VTSLAVGKKEGGATLIYAGVNSSLQDTENGRNMHFRIFGFQNSSELDDKSAISHSITEISRSSIFDGKEKFTYQRITRLSKPFPGQPQLGAVATGLAQESQVSLFDTSATSPPISRGSVKSNKEAIDVDVIQTAEHEYQFAYCDEHDIYFKKISTEANDEEPECIYITPATRTLEKPTVPSFRALRWLTKEFLLMLANIHSNGGVVLQILRIPPSGKGQARIVQSHRLPDSIKKAVGMAVANLTPPLKLSDPQGYTQFVIAVAAQNISISLFKVDLAAERNVSLVTRIKAFRTFKNVHPAVITNLTFSNFTPPSQPVTGSTPPQHLRLASVGVSNTVVVHTLPLFPVPLSVQRGQSKTPRYVVALPSTAAAFGMSIAISIIGVALAAILIQSILEIRGGVPSYLGARNHLPVIWQEALGRPYEFPSGYNISSSVISTDAAKATDYISDIISEGGSALRLPEFFKQLKEDAKKGVVILKEGSEKEIQAHIHDEKKDGPHGGKAWDELGHDQKQIWKKKLKEAGHWAEDMGETVLKGMLFGEIAGAIGQAVAGG